MISNYLKRQRLINFSLVFFMVTVGLIMIVGSFIMFFKEPQKPVPYDALFSNVQESCIKSFRDLGHFGVRPNADRGVSLFEPDLTYAPMVIATISAASASCYGYDISYFCAGTDCQRSGISIDLTINH